MSKYIKTFFFLQSIWLDRIRNSIFFLIVDKSSYLLTKGEIDMLIEAGKLDDLAINISLVGRLSFYFYTLRFFILVYWLLIYYTIDVYVY